MLQAGLVTVTFRKFDRAKICGVARNAGLSLLEWGGDVHVPPGDRNAVAEAVRLSDAAGLTIDTYGSYYRCTPEEDAQIIVSTAASLGARNIRVWAGKRGSADTSGEDHASVVRQLRGICSHARQASLTVSAEFHGGTLTDDVQSALRLVDEVGEENFRLYWQPNQFRDDPYNLAAVRLVLPVLTNVHVFAWSGHGKYPLAEQESLWRAYIETVASDGRDHGLLLEFVCDDTEEQLYRDAETLKGWIG